MSAKRIKKICQGGQIWENKAKDVAVIVRQNTLKQV